MFEVLSSNMDKSVNINLTSVIEKKKIKVGYAVYIYIITFT